MDVRCEQCDTEYELEDSAVPPGGCPVQCASCGYTFWVMRPAAPSDPNDDPEPAPPPAEWLLETADGKLHRFRNLTSLQKWIIERKVTRDDKISRTGHAWRRLGEIVELGPFFDVVDEADRARAAGAAHGDARPTAHAPRARVASRSRQPAPITPADTLTGRPGPHPVAAAESIDIDPRDRVPSLPRDEPEDDGYAGNAPEDEQPTPAGTGVLDHLADEDADFEAPVVTAVVPARRSPIVKFGVVFLIAAGVSAGAIYLSQSRARSGANADSARPTKELAPAAVPAPLPAPEQPAPAAQALAPALSPEPAPAPALPPAQPPDATPAAHEAAPRTGSPPATVPVKTEPGEKAPPRLGEEASYDKLLEQADRVLENGGTERAFKLYERALALRPDGVDALVGLGYVMMDRGRNALAVSYFQRALGIAPQYGPALFGLGEALRAAGNDLEALRAYQRYLEVSPSGRYTMAARRQIQALQESIDKTTPNE